MSTSVDVVVKLLGDSKGFQKAMKSAQVSAATTGQKMKAAMSQAAAGAAIALAAASAVVAKSIATYADYGKAIKTVMRLTGATSEAASTLVGQWRLSGVEAEKGATGMRFLAKAMYAARTATSAQAKVFKTLGISLKDSNGSWIDSTEILRQVRDRMAGMTDATERTALAIALFGRGGTALLPWLTKSNDEIDKQTKLLKSLGLVWTAQDMKKWGDLAQAQRTLSLAMTALQIRIAEVAVPLLTKLLPAMTKLTAVLQKIPAPVYQAAAAFLALLVAMNGILKVKAILTGFGIAKGLAGLPAVLGRITTLFAGLPALIAANAAALAPYVVSVAALTVAIWKTVEAYRGWRSAEADLAAQRAANVAQEQNALNRIAAKYGRNSEQYRKMVAAINEANAQMVADQEKQLTGLADWLDSWAQGLNSASWVSGPAKFILGSIASGTSTMADWVGLASGGYVPPRVGGTPVIVGEGGEGEYVVPASKMGTSRGGDVHVHIGTLVGTDERAARQLSEMVGKHLMRGVSRGMVGQNA